MLDCTASPEILIRVNRAHCSDAPNLVSSGIDQTRLIVAAAMGWEFAAIWVEDPDETWLWVWRRVADDSGAALQQSTGFSQLEHCIEDARKHGFDEGECGSIL